MAKKTKPARYFSYSEEGLQNGSFARTSQYGVSWFNLGDFMGFVEKAPEGWVEFPQLRAESLIPDCCR